MDKRSPLTLVKLTFGLLIAVDLLTRTASLGLIQYGRHFTKHREYFLADTPQIRCDI